jgi:hypothetical protein
MGAPRNVAGEKGMIVFEEQGRRIVVGRIGLCLAFMLILFLALFSLSGCGGPSKEEQAKLDEQGRQTNEAAMKRMIQEQGRPGGAPGAGGR